MVVFFANRSYLSANGKNGGQQNGQIKPVLQKVKGKLYEKGVKMEFGREYNDHTGVERGIYLCFEQNRLFEG